MAMHEICCIIDFDGFSFKGFANGSLSKKEFLIREIGYVRIDPEFGDFLSKSFRFDLTFYDFGQINVDWQTIHHQTRYITGLPFKPQQGEKVHDYELIQSCIQKIYEICRQPGRHIVAFKGGNSEREILKELNIPSLDLGHFGCPKYEDLVKAEMVTSHLIDCGYHEKISKSVPLVHCPRAEVTAFKDWLMLQYPAWTKGAIPCGYTAVSSHPLSSADSCSAASSTSGCN